MATAGRKPKSARLRLVEGNPGKRPIADDVAHQAPPEGHSPLERPSYLRRGTKAAQLWGEVAATCWWLGNADRYKLGMWCALEAEFQKSPAKMVAARIAQLRALGSELGLDPASRARLGSMKGDRKPAANESKKPGASSYFED